MNNKKLYYISWNRFPTEKANWIQIAHMCEAFGVLWLNVCLLVPKRKNTLEAKNPYKYYSVKKKFSIHQIWCIDGVRYTKYLWLFWNIITKITFLLWTFFYFLFLDRESTIYTREVEMWVIFRLLGYKKVFFECHSLPQRQVWLYDILISNFAKVIVITHWLKEKLVSSGHKDTTIVVAHDWVSTHTVTYDWSKKSAREKIWLDSTITRVLVYTGHYYPRKWIDTVFEVATKVTQYTYVFVWWTKEDIYKYSTKYSEYENIIIVWKVDYAKIKYYLASADILLLPNSWKYVMSQTYTSPLKLFEYMASNRPILASDLSSLKEVLDESSATFFKADNAKDLLERINYVFDNYEESLKFAANAKLLSDEYTRDKRAMKILNAFVKYYAVKS